MLAPVGQIILFAASDLPRHHGDDQSTPEPRQRRK
jgi:hypothetical protein